MIVREDGTVLGSTGGGSGEATVIREAIEAIRNDRGTAVTIDMFADETTAEGMVCGGTMNILIEPLQKAHDQEWLEALTRETDSGHEALLIRRSVGPDWSSGASRMEVRSVEGERIWPPNESTAGTDETGTISLDFAGIAGQDLSIQTPDGQDFSIVIERVKPARRLIIIGGGHIGAVLCRFAHDLDFHVTVVDDRSEFTGENRFSTGTRVLHGDYGRLLNDISGGADVCFALVSRGYRVDVEALRAILGKECAYLGMIGSRRRVATVKRILAKEGFSTARLQSVRGPIGLSIGAETPAEIAVSILAEIISVLRKRCG